MSAYRPEIPWDMPEGIAALPVHRGYPVPWFVAWLDGARPTKRGEGIPDFRVLYPGASETAYVQNICWVCGRPFYYGETNVFAVGPMCIVNRTSAEPSMHAACADWSARACPFIMRPSMKRNEVGLPEHTQEVGKMIRRNPGVFALWASPGLQGSTFGGRNGWFTWRDPRGGLLFNIGEPIEIRWYREGRTATREEIVESLESGLPILREESEKEEGGVEMLEQQYAAAMVLLPA